MTRLVPGSRDPVAKADAILEIEHLDVGFTQYGRRVQVLHDVNLAVGRGERVALIGQSGSGKTVTMRTVIGTLPMPPADVPRGSVRFEGRELLSLGARERNRLKGTGISIVLQDPLLSFNPVLTIGRQMDDVVRFADRRLGRSRGRRERRARLVETLGRVQLADAERVLGALPMQLSGGMRQRVLIAMALLNEPSLLIADEPGTALDVTTQQEILALLNRLVADTGLSLLLITHNLGVVRESADRVYVMHAGRVVESGSRATIFDAPRDAYTRRLMASVPPLYGPRVRDVVAEPSADAVLALRGVTKRFEPPRRGLFRTPRPVAPAVDEVDLDVRRGEILGIAGESGSGKTTLARMMLGLIAPTSGSIELEGLPIARRAAEPDFRRRLQIVHQNPGSSLNPRRRVDQQLAVPLRFAGHARAVVRRRIPGLLERVELGAEHATRYPHELSGGQKQRVAIARALAADPELIVLDEPTSALDVLVQDTVIELLLALRAEHGLTYVFISHDLSLMRNFCNRVAVMYRGRVCERNDTRALFESPSHPYTRALIGAIPVISDAEAASKPAVTAEERAAVLASSTA